MQIVNQLDGLHKKYRQAMYLFAAPVVLLVIAYIGAPGMGAMAGTVVAVLMFAVPVGTIYASGRMSKINKEYQMIYKNAFVVSILNKTFSDVQVNWECGFTRQNVEQMGLLKLGNRFDSEDLIHGAYEGVSFDQADVTIKNVTGSGKNRHTTTYFKGRVFVFDLQKSDIRSVGIRSKNFQYYGNLNGFHHENVKLESEAFNREFKVMAAYPVDAFYVLTPQTMECVTDLYRRAGNVALRYLGNKLYVALTKRYDVLTKMLDVVKGYQAHEKTVLTELVKLRSGMTMAEKNAANQKMEQLTKDINILAENYPELKSSNNFMELQKTIADVEEHLQAARRLYNANVNTYNTKLVVFPSSIVANNMHAVKKPFFEAEEAKRQDVKMSF